jgi:hypothetical protein
MGLLDEIKAEDQGMKATRSVSAITGKVIAPQEIYAKPKPTSLVDEIKTEEPSFYQKWVKPIAEPVIEAAGLTAGGIVGAAAGLPFGGIFGAAMGAPVGAGLGYAGAKQAYRIAEGMVGVGEESPMPFLEQVPEQLIRSGKEIATGAASEMAGQAVGQIAIGAVRGGAKAAKWIGGKLGIPPVTEKGMKAEALKRFTELKAKAEGSPQILENIEAAKELEERIPRLKLSYGQITNDADAIMLERSLARGGGATLSQQQRAVANKALEDYYASKVTGAGIGKPEEFVKALGREKGVLETTVKQTQQTVDTEVARLSHHLDEQSIGRKIYGLLSEGQKIARTKATALYNKIPDIKIKTDILNKTLDDVLTDFDPIVEKSTNIPSKLVTGLKEITENGTKPLAFQQLRKLRSTILSEIRTVQGSAVPNTQYIRRLKMIQDGIENTIDSLSGESGKAGDLYRTASSFYKEYASKYKQGTVAEVLAKGVRGEETRIGMANIASKFDGLDGIDDFVKAVGDKNIARDSMRDYYQFDFLNPRGEITTKRAAQWLYENAGKLKKLGLFDEFKDIVMKRRGLEFAEKNLDVFNKSVANKILEADVNDLVKKAFKGSGNYAATAQQLLNKVKDNKAATAGFKKAFAENLMKETESTAPEFFQTVGAETVDEVEFVKSVAKLTNNLGKYSSAIRIIYKDEPQKIKAIYDVWNAYQTLARTAKSPIGGGSDTVENLFNILAGAGGARAGRFYLIKSIRDAFSKNSTRHINEYMRRMMFDPEYAANFVSFKTGITPEKINNFNRLMTLISYETGKEIKSKTEDSDDKYATDTVYQHK